MARAGWVKPAADQRLSDHISIGVLTRVFPPEVVDAIVAATGRGEHRRRLLPARVVVYYVLGLALFSDASYEEVMRQLVEGLAWWSGWQTRWTVPTKAALFQARRRLGPEPLAALFAAVAQPVGLQTTPGVFYRDWRLLSLDGTCLDVADTPANATAFGRPGASRGNAVGAFPQVRLVGLAECGTHALLQVALGPYTMSERRLADRLIPNLPSGTLVLADRGLYSFERWQRAAATGAALCWRVSTRMRLPRDVVLEDGSYHSRLYAFADRHRHQDPMVVRVVEYRLDDPGRPGQAEGYRLLTTVLEPGAAPAPELAALYGQRWEFETVLDELKTHQRGPRVVLRSKQPSGVEQEVYGYLCVHHAIGRLMHDAALEAALAPQRLSFLRSLRAARRSTRTAPGFSP